MADGRGSYSERTEIALSDEVKGFVAKIKDKRAAYTAAHEQYRQALEMEIGGIDRLNGESRTKWLTLWEQAAQIAMKWYIMPEIPLGYAYRLKLLGLYSDSNAMKDIVDASGGLYRSEMCA